LPTASASLPYAARGMVISRNKHRRNIMATNEESAVSGGLLVVLGIVVALGAAALFYRYGGDHSGPEINIHADIPSPTKVAGQ
jgi:hypothetical protein